SLVAGVLRRGQSSDCFHPSPPAHRDEPEVDRVRRAREMTGWFRTGRVMVGEPGDRVEAWLRRRFPQYPHVVKDLYRDTCAALMSWLVLVVVGVAAVLGLQLGVTFVDALRHAGLVIVGLVAA